MIQYTSKCSLYSMHTDSLNTPNQIVKHEFHNHNQYELFYLQKGCVKYNVEGVEYTLNEREVLFINYHEYHSIYVISPNIYDRIVIQVNEFFLSNFVLSYDIFEFIRVKPVGKNNKISSDLVKNYGIDSIFLKLAQLTSPLPETEILIKCSLVELVIALSNAYSDGNITESKQKQSPLFSRLVDYINKNLKQNLTLDILAKEFFLTKYHLCHEFKKVMDISINEYIITKRVLLANNLINQGMSATEACYETGFRSYPNFYRAFLKTLNHAPTGNKHTD